MRPIWFAIDVWEQLMLFGKWTDEHGSFIGAITLASIGAAVTVGAVKRRALAPALAWVRAHAILTTILSTPFAAFILLCINKYLTAASALAATVGVLVALANNNRTHDREERRFERQMMAARTSLTHELSAICEYCEALVKALNSIQRMSPEEQLQACNDTQFPPPPPTASATIKEMINSTRDAEVAKRCAQIQRFLQLTKANLRLLREWSSIYEVNIPNQLMRISILYGITSSLFGYAREGDGEISPFTWDDVTLAVTVLELEMNAEFSEYYERSEEIYPDPLMFNKMRQV